MHHGQPTVDRHQRANKQIWGRRTSRKLTSEDEREIEQNVVGFFRLLAEWAAKENGETDGEIADVAGMTSSSND